jgi:phenylpropionate dioxygenase-like ring-hydroxylating dioxygenase large terminal subunit
MLNAADNELLCRTNPGTPMGELFRRFWLPALLSDELPGPDCPPIRHRILGEDLVAFRDSDGRIAFLREACPHRKASLFLGRNEEGGLRCVYHGWKFDVSGQCVDLPSEPPESNFRDKIQTTAYPGAEWGGLIWVYMGPESRRPGLPQYDWCVGQPSPHLKVWKWLQESNYAQGLEGNIDSTHVSFLHRWFTGGTGGTRSEIADGAPRLTAQETDFGFIYGAMRGASNDEHYWRVTPFVMPSYTVIPNPNGSSGGLILVPQDDEHTWWFTIATREPDPSQPPYVTLIPGTWRQERNSDNNYLIDREMQRTVNYTGLPTNRVQDAAVTESMGAFVDRSDEHLGTSDTAIIFMRKLLIAAAHGLQQGIEPAIFSDPSLFRVRPIDMITAKTDLGRLWADHSAALKKEFASVT